MKVNLDLTAAAAENLISDELKNNVGAAAFNMEHDFFYGGTEMEIWTAAGGTGTQLTEGVDYTLGDIDANFTTRAGRNVYTTVTIDNVTYQTGDLYFTYQATADYVDADDRYMVVRATGQYWELTSGGAFEVYTTDAGASSVKIDTLGGVDIDVDNGLTINEDSGATFTLSGSGAWTMVGAGGQNLLFQSNSAGNLTTQADGQLRLYGQSTAIDTVRIRAANGGIDMDSVLGTHIQDLYGDTGTGGGITILSDNNNASGTGGDITIQSQATSGTSGKILLDSASTAADALKLTTTGGMQVNAAGANDSYFRGFGNSGLTIESDGTIELRGFAASQPMNLITNNATIGLSSGTGVIQLTSTNTGTGAIDVNSSGGIDIDAAGAFTIDATGNSSLTNSNSVAAQTFTLTHGNTGAVVMGDLIIETTNTNASGTGGDITLRTTAAAGTSGDIDILSAEDLFVDANDIYIQQTTAGSFISISNTGKIDIYSAGVGQNTEITSQDDDIRLLTYSGGGAAGSIIIDAQSTNANAIDMNSGGGVDIDAATTVTVDASGTSAAITVTSQHTDATTGADLSITSDVNNAGGTGGDVVIATTATSGTAGGIDLQTTGTSRVTISAGGDTVFFGTASTTGALPVITLDQADVDEPFIKVVGDAAAATLTNNLVDTGDVTTPTIIGYFKIEVLDDGNQITDGDYFVPFYSLA